MRNSPETRRGLARAPQRSKSRGTAASSASRAVPADEARREPRRRTRMAEIAVGIDLGTSNSCVAIARGRRVEVLPNAYGERITASVVQLRRRRRRSWSATRPRRNIIHDPTHTVYSAKRLIGRYFFSEEVKKAQGDLLVQDRRGREPQRAHPDPRRAVLAARDRRDGAARDEVDRRGAARRSRSRQAVDHGARLLQRQPAPGDARRRRGSPASRCCGILNEPTAAALAYGFGKDLNQQRRRLRPRRRHVRHLGARDRRGRLRGALDLRRHLPRRRRLRRPR